MHRFPDDYAAGSFYGLIINSLFRTQEDIDEAYREPLPTFTQYIY